MELLAVNVLNTEKRGERREDGDGSIHQNQSCCVSESPQHRTNKQTSVCESHLREAQVEHVGVELAQSSGEAVAAQIVSAELAGKTNSTERRLKMDAATSAKMAPLFKRSHLLQSFLGRLTSSMWDRIVTSCVVKQRAALMV